MRSPLWTGPVAVCTAAALVLTAGVATAVRTDAPVVRVVPAAAAAAPVQEAGSPPEPVAEVVPEAAEVLETGRSDLSAYRGLGTWLDAYDWAPSYGGTTPVEAVDAMAAQGVKTLYLQAATRGRKNDGMLHPELLGQFLVRAHERGIAVQAWYLPLLDDVARDTQLLDEILAFRAQGHAFDTVGLDIEWRNSVPDVAERNRRLVAVSQHLRAAAPEMPLAAIVVAPVLTEDVNRAFWRPFPWQELRPLYDVWQTMGYWTDRKASSRWSDAYTSTLGNIRFVRRLLGDPGAPVHPIGGIGAATAAEAEGFVRATQEDKALGGSLYDWPTTPAARYPVLRGVPQ